MGYNATVVILNDRLHEIEKDLEFGQKLSQLILMNDRKNYPHLKNTIPYHYGIDVAGVNHADVTSVVVTGGNCGTEIFSEYYGDYDLNTQQGLTKLVQMMASKLGCKLVADNSEEGRFNMDKERFKENPDEVLKSLE